MGYLHISNLYKEQSILLFKECYALEKVHGSSAHVSWNGEKLHFFSGGESQTRFEAIFDHEKLKAGFVALGHGTTKVTVFGEVYGGKCQGMRETYGEDLKFIAFDVAVGNTDSTDTQRATCLWLSVPDMAEVATGLGLEVVPYSKIPATLEALDAARDAPSEVAKRRGITDPKPREGIVARPLFELTKNNGERILCKHKIEKFNERSTPQKVIDPYQLQVLASAQAIADEWVTEMRLTHVLQKLPEAKGMEQVKKVIEAMVEEVYREAKGEVIESREATAAIGKRTASMFKQRLVETMRQAHV